jgi:hypothetical protein
VERAERDLGTRVILTEFYLKKKKLNIFWVNRLLPLQSKRLLRCPSNLFFLDYPLQNLFFLFILFADMADKKT